MCSLPARRHAERRLARGNSPVGTFSTVARCIILLLLALLGPAPAAFGSDPVLLWRTPLTHRSVCALTGRELTFPPEFEAPDRVWAGILTLQDGGPAREELQRQHRSQRQQLTTAWQQELGDDSDAKAELASRQRHAEKFDPRYFDVVVARRATSQDLLWLIDDNLDGILTLRGTVRPDVHAAAGGLPDQSLRMWLHLDGSDARAKAARLPEIPAPPVSSSAPATGAAPDDESISSLQQQLRALDHPSVRKQNLVRIVAIADRLVTLLEADERPPAAVLADVLYRKGRALGYRELPDVVAVMPIEDQTALDQDFEHTFDRLRALVDVTQPKFILLAIRRERRRGWRGTALDLLELYQQRHQQPLWYRKKRQDLLKELGLTLLAHQAAAELWLFGERPVRPVPVIFQRHGSSGTDVLPADWLPQEPWRSPAVQLRACCGGSVREGVAWLTPHQNFRIQWAPAEHRTCTVDDGLIRGGARILLP